MTATLAEATAVELRILAVLPHGTPTPLLVRATSSTTIDELAAALGDRTGDGPRPLHAGLRPLARDATLTEAGLVDGALVGVGFPVAEVAPPAGGWEVAIVGGLHAGAAVPALPDARLVVGRGPDADLDLPDPEVSRRHAALTLVAASDAAECAHLVDLGSRNGTGWCGYRLDQAAPIGEHDAVQVGESVVSVRRAAPPDPVLQAGATPGTVGYNRPPHIAPPRSPQEVHLPAEPTEPRRLRFPLAAVLLPLVLGAAMFGVMGPTPYLLFMVLSPVMALSNVLGERRSSRRAYRQARARYDAAVADLEDDLARLVAEEERTARHDQPDPASLLAIACGPTGRLWERRPGEPSFLHLRVGLADRPAAVRLRVGTSQPGDTSTGGPTPPPARLVPVTVDVAQAGVVGMAGPRPVVLSTARALLASAATLHSPRDLHLVVITGATEVDDWRWAAWLPHLIPADDGSAARGAVAVGRAQADARLAELVGLVARRAAGRGNLLDAAPSPEHAVLVVIDGARRTRSLPGVPELLHDGPAAGVLVLCLDDDEASLPAECGATIEVGDVPTRAVVRRPGHEPVGDVLVDGLSLPLADRLARALAPVRELGGAVGLKGALPGTARLLDLLPGGVPDAAAVGRGWRSRPGGRSTEVLLGVAGEGPLILDLAADGPHALVAGTTGSGKSELLQTMVASLALGNHPEQLHIVLVDYKGGAAFAACTDLPHCVGFVTDLDQHLAERALASLSAELRRREHLLATQGAKDIDDYWAVGAPEPLARLVIVIDEFATLAREVPDFVPGIVAIGMRGRSLGVHIVLATQRPAGAVVGDLRANVSIRVCLRVADAAESNDVIDAPDAAHIPLGRPGRAYLRIGPDAPTCFQTARVGGLRPETEAASDDPAVTISAVELLALGDPMISVPATGDPIDPADTDLAAVVAAVRAAAEAEGVERQLGPWLPPLPPTVTLAEIEQRFGATDLDPAAPGLVATIGLADRPDLQQWEPWRVDLERLGSLLVCGSSRSGRSTVLRGMAVDLARRRSPADLHLYVVDAGNRTLAPLAALPHCGAWVDADDTERVERLMAWLGDEVARRQRHLSAGGCASLRELRARGHDRMPYLVVMVDKLEAFNALYADRDGGVVTDALDRLLREGPAAGMLPVLAADRTGVTSRLLSTVEHRLVLRQAERDDYVWLDVPSRSAPVNPAPGRGVWTGGVVEVQVALLDPDPRGAAQAAAVAELAAASRERWAGVPDDVRPHRIDPLPTAVTLAEAQTARSGTRPGGPVATIAVGGDELAPIDVDLDDLGPGFVVAGPPRSGRSTALGAVAATIQRPVIVLAPRPSPLRHLAGRSGVVDVYTSAEQAADQLGDQLDAMDRPVAVLVDDAELLTDRPIAALLDHVMRAARDHGIVVVAATTIDHLVACRFRGWLAEARRSRSGLLLRPSSSLDGDAFDLRLPRSLAGGWPAGRGLLVTRGQSQMVQVVQVE